MLTPYARPHDTCQAFITLKHIFHRIVFFLLTVANLSCMHDRNETERLDE
jgi:hypothetical protein